MAPLHVRQQVGSARDRQRVRAFRGKDLRRLADRLRGAVLEPRKPHHDPATPASAFFFGASLTALPSPPSHGGGTIIGSGYGTCGNFAGPTRGSLPCAFSASARSTLSGVIGISSIRTPTAS